MGLGRDVFHGGMEIVEYFMALGLVVLIGLGGGCLIMWGLSFLIEAWLYG